MSRQTFTLPFPPSANRLWRNVHGKTLKSREYRIWEQEAGLLLRLARPRPVSSPAGVHITVHGGKGFTRSRDIDNLQKPCLDLLVHGGVLTGDSCVHVVEVQCRYVEGGKSAVARFEVEVFPVGREEA